MSLITLYILPCIVLLIPPTSISWHHHFTSPTAQPQSRDPFKSILHIHQPIRTMKNKWKMNWYLKLLKNKESVSFTNSSITRISISAQWIHKELSPCKSITKTPLSHYGWEESTPSSLSTHSTLSSLFPPFFLCITLVELSVVLKMSKWYEEETFARGSSYREMSEISLDASLWWHLPLLSYHPYLTHFLGIPYSKDSVWSLIVDVLLLEFLY